MRKTSFTGNSIILEINFTFALAYAYFCFFFQGIQALLAFHSQNIAKFPPLFQGEYKSDPQLLYVSKSCNYIHGQTANLY